jgi:diguanylate cyclase (GGDEF)-like protein
MSIQSLRALTNQLAGHQVGLPLPAAAPPPDLDDHTGSLEQTVDFFARVTVDGRFTYLSDRGLEFIGYHRGYLQILTLPDLVPDGEFATLMDCFDRARERRNMQKCTLHLVKTLTYPRLVELRINACEQHPDEFTVVAFDVSSWLEREQSLIHDAHHDALTGLPNLTAARHEIDRVAGEVADPTMQAAVLLVDLDEYHRVNHAFGYEAGDRIMQETAQRLQKIADRREFVARAEGDSFLIVVSHTPGREEVADLARRVSDAIQQPYTLDNQTLQLSVSIGAVMFPEQRHQSNKVLRQADDALIRAKRVQGATRLCFFEPNLRTKGADALKLESDMYNGIRNGEFSLHYQPISDARTQQVVGVEALMRWQHPVHGAVPPSVFIPLAESGGLINFLGEWALRNTCMQLAQWDNAGIRLPYATVNVSAHQFRDRRFPDVVREAIALTGITAERIVLEITESVLMHDPARAKMLLEELTAIGIRFAVDDFGTGYSSLAYLQRFPLSTLKIDRSFIVNLPHSVNDQAIVAAVVALARSLNLELVAEGVETPEQRQMLASSGCHLIQGWVVCKALPVDQLARKFALGELRTVSA